MDSTLVVETRTAAPVLCALVPGPAHGWAWEGREGREGGELALASDLLKATKRRRQYSE